MYAERGTHAEQRPYAEMELPHRWPMVVRERAVEIAKRRADADAETLTHAAEPPTDPEDEIFLLGERCARAYMQADALHYRAMKLLAEFDRRSGWQDTGFASTAEWLAWRIGIKPGAARERLRTALALEQLPLTAEAMKNGELSFTKVRALTRVARPDNETTLLEFARAGSAANLERVVRGWKALDRKSEVTAEQIRHRSRRFSAWVDDDGMVVVNGRLDPEVGALLMRAVEAASDALYREAAGLEETQPEQRRADAVGLIAERALGAGFGVRGGEDAEHPEEDSIPVSGTRAERYQVMLHVDAGTLEEDGDAGQSELEDGTRVSAETSRRIACDAGLVKIAHGADGQIVGVGRRSRTVPPSVRRALEARDRGCRFPGCGLRFTDAHHVKHWADGGETTLRNVLLLCRRHHRAVHEGGVRVCIDRTQQVVFFTPRGKALFDVPPVRDRSMAGISPEPGADLPEPGADLGRDGGRNPGGSRTPDDGGPRQLRPSHLEGASRWKRDGEIPWAVEARAWEALDSG
ncbi:DUF222 domain-containing protein [Gemmatimonadota bacterium]